MEINVFENYDLLCEATALKIAEIITRKPNSLVCLPGGNSPVGVFRRLEAMVNGGKLDIGDCRFVGLDEYIGMDKDQEGSCKYTVYRHFFEPLRVPSSRITYFDARADSLDTECCRIDRFISEYGPIDLMLLGIGLNGHLGLNEPGVSFDNTAHVVEMQPSTRAAVQKFFENKDAAPTHGISLGAKQILASGTVILMANGKSKAEIMKRVIAEEVTNSLPATMLKLHPNSFIFMDSEAAMLYFRR